MIAKQWNRVWDWNFVSETHYGSKLKVWYLNSQSKTCFQCILLFRYLSLKRFAITTYMEFDVNM
jgi:hypothetical protein